MGKIDKYRYENQDGIYQTFAQFYRKIREYFYGKIKISQLYRVVANSLLNNNTVENDSTEDKPLNEKYITTIEEDRVDTVAIQMWLKDRNLLPKTSLDQAI